MNKLDANKELYSNITYSEIVGLVKERNRPSGGLKTVHEVAINAFLNKTSNILEIGSNTGFTSVNLSLLTGCQVLGIDVVDNSIREATKYAQEQGVQDAVKFEKANATSLPLKDQIFDLVWASNVTSFIQDKNQAIKEYSRVLKTGGYLAFVPIYYINTPPESLLKQVEEAIGTKIDIKSRSDWMDMINNTGLYNDCKLELVYQKDYKYLDRTPALDNYIDMILSKSELAEYSEEEAAAIKNKYTYFMKLFNENLSYCGYSTFIYQKRNLLDETELFLSTEN